MAAQLANDAVVSGIVGVLIEFFAIGDLADSARFGRYKCEF